ncbi:MAG: hypothetical protein JW763_07600 [candidate division Zixibacteria bacterium]|nr:hypothetical protein [candidate division Zixibacteria bacterium]
MMKKYLLGGMVLLAAVVIYSCSDRGSNVDPLTYDTGLVLDTYTQHAVSYLADAPLVTNATIKYQVYLPAGYKDYGLGEPMPVLYLLTPFRGRVQYYFNHGLTELADRMIGTGEIRPMVLFVISGYNDYGGCFFGSSRVGGDYVNALGNIVDPEDCLAGPFATFLDYANCLINTIPDSVGYRAITGIGMGGYGAMRIAVEFPEHFSAVSAVSAPLDFDGADNASGFLPLFQDFMNDVGRDNYSAIQFDFNNVLQSMLLAASVAYSPHDTGIVDDGFVITDETSYFNDNLYDAAYHLPFYRNGQQTDTLYDTVTVDPLDVDTTIVANGGWVAWQENNIPTILEANPTALDETAVLLAYTTDSDEYTFNEQTGDFHDLLVNTYGKVEGVDLQTITFDGYSDYIASGDRFIFDLLPEILKFHSDNFYLSKD